jgi:hypothetical protein
MSSPAIQIILNPDGSTTFSPSSQTALRGDLVFWNNQTKENHQPWPTDSNYKPEGKPWFPPVPPGETSGDYATPQVPLPPAPPPPPQTIYYFCKLHPHRTSERGTITLVNSLP